MLKIVRFMDMHSGGGCKVGREYILVEAASEEDAVEVFREVFDRDPYQVTCHCCGPDYSISVGETLEEATEYDRTRGQYTKDKPCTVAEYLARTDVLFIPAKES